MNEMTDLKIAEQQPSLAEKKPRALPRVWARFWRLKNEDTFFVGAQKSIKCSFFTYAHVAEGFQCVINDSSPDFKARLIAPWRRVKTTVFIRDARPGGKSSVSADRQLYGSLDKPYSAGHEGTPYRGSVGLCAPSIEQTGPSA